MGIEPAKVRQLLVLSQEQFEQVKAREAMEQIG
jgi:hypothetical protein